LGRSWAVEGAQEQVDRDTPVSRTPTDKHLMFECVVLWENVSEVFDINVTNFETIASKWLCNKKFLHLNLVTSVVL
jgi:hypothetical protein